VNQTIETDMIFLICKAYLRS